MPVQRRPLRLTDPKADTMTRKKKRPHTRSERLTRAHGHPGRRARAAVLASFVAWYDAGPPAEDAPSSREVAHALDVLLDAAAAAIPGLDPAQPDAAALGALLVSVTEGADNETGAAAAFALHEYLHFLQDTGTWRGDEEEMQAGLDLAHALLEPEAPLLDALLDDTSASPAFALAPAARRAATDATPVVHAIPRLLTLIGTSRPVTATGALRRADIGPVALLLGVVAVGVRSRPDQPTLDLGVLDDTDAEPEPHLQVTSMRDVLELDAWWHALQAAGVIEVSATTARPGPRAGDWGSTASQTALGLREDIVSEFVARVIGHEMDPPHGGFMAWPIGLDLVHHLALATRPDIEPGKASADLLTTDDANDSLYRLLHLRTAAVMQALGRLGLVEVLPVDGGVRYVVPEGLRPAVARAVRQFGDG